MTFSPSILPTIEEATPASLLFLSNSHTFWASSGEAVKVVATWCGISAGGGSSFQPNRDLTSLQVDLPTSLPRPLTDSSPSKVTAEVIVANVIGSSGMVTSLLVRTTARWRQCNKI